MALLEMRSTSFEASIFVLGRNRSTTPEYDLIVLRSVFIGQDSDKRGVGVKESGPGWRARACTLFLLETLDTGSQPGPI